LHQQPVSTLPAARHSPAERGHADWLAAHRPDLADRFATALPHARAAVLGRLWGAIAREPLPGRGTAVEEGGDLTVTVNGITLRGPAAAARPFAAAPVGLTICGYTAPGALAAALWPAHGGFAAELDNSVANLALARATAGAPVGDDLVEAEQSIVDGHPLHPCCRTRTGMDAGDVLAYAPEHRPTVALPLVAVPSRHWHSTGAGLPPVLPVHPWQWARLRDRYPWLVDTGDRVTGRPLMSLRTIATAHGHLKTAVDAQLTSAVRTVSAAATHNGPLLSALLARLTAGTPGLCVLAEPAGGAVVVDGAPCRSLAVIHRAAPRLAAGERVFPLAALTAGRPHVTDLAADPVAFVADLAGLLLPPLLRLLDLGVGLEAHGQNLLLVTASGRPRRLLYRDFGGVRVDVRRLARHGVEAPPLHGDIPTTDPEAPRTKVLASAVATVLADLVATLAGRFGTGPAALWAAVARSVPRDTPGAAHLYTADRLPLKAMTAMRLAGSADDIWTTVSNPLAGLR
jgi:siderophore synthetase component